MKLAGYIRVSTEGQVDAYGKEVQRKFISEWAEMNGHNIYQWYEEDAVTGKADSAERPALSDILESADRFDGIVFFDATRIARRSFMQETLLNLIWATGLRVFTTTNGELCVDEDDPTKILIRQVIAAVAEFDHRSIVKKLHAARRLKSADGGYIGGTPEYGRSVVGTGRAAQFVQNAVESEVIMAIKEMRDSGESLRAIASALNAKHIPTKTGKEWRASQVQRILQRYESESTKAVREATC